MEISAKDLPELAGWRVVKEARNLVSAGCVTNASITHGTTVGEPCRLQGAVTEGRRRYISGLIIHSLREAENLCNCIISRRDGQICLHSVAVALVALQEESLKIGREATEVSDDEGGTVDYTKLKWLPVPQFGHQDISLRSIFPVKFRRVRGKGQIDVGIRNRIIELFGKWQICFPQSDQIVEINRSQFLQLLSAFKGGVWKGDKVNGDIDRWPDTRVAEIPARIPIRLSESSNKAGMVDIEPPELPQSAILTDESDCWIFRHGDHLALPTRFSLLSSPSRGVLVELFKSGAESGSLAVKREWLQNEIEQFNLVFHMECSDGLSESLRVVPGVPAVSLGAEGSLRRLDLKLTFSYKDGEIPDPNFHSRAFRMLGVGEWSSLEPSNAGLSSTDVAVMSGYNKIFKASLSGEEMVIAFYAGPLDQLFIAGEWNVDIGPRFTQVTRDLEKVRPKAIPLGQGNDWLSFDLKFSTDDGVCVPENEIRRLLQTGSSRVRLPGGKQAAFDRESVESLFEAMGDADVEHDGDFNEGRTVRSGNRLLFEELASKFFADGTMSGPDKSRIDRPKGFCGELRSYQQFGLEWLYSRALRGHGAILADEMGLGKTVQVLALVALLEGLQQDVHGNAGLEESANACIIICPTSLIKMWEKEIARFLPSKSVLVLQGSNRSSHFHDMDSVDIVITSYGALSRDISRYPPLTFALLVADEASHLRNPKTQASRNIAKISSRSRVALTGTPMENSIQDLWAIMNFSNPGYLESREKFMALYGDGCDEKTRRLRRKITPFMLRRTKADVAADLPAKIERVLYCELSVEQRRAYEQVLNFSRDAFKNMRKSLTARSQRMEVLVLLLRLRQICCDLRLVSGGDVFKSLISNPVIDGVRLPRIPAGNPEGAEIKTQLSAAHSAKLKTLGALITKSLAEGHKILIFSQFVSMLNCIRKYLDSSDLKYCYLDGSQSVEQREKQIQSFQSDKGLFPIFLMSLKAGGYGLTLTEADTVIHFDPWWNPAVEAQATDRAHRIGQTHTVTSYKLIVSGTIEEKILLLQNRKRNVADVALDDECPLMESLSNEDIEYILS